MAAGQPCHSSSLARDSTVRATGSKRFNLASSFSHAKRSRVAASLDSLISLHFLSHKSPGSRLQRQAKLETPAHQARRPCLTRLVTRSARRRRPGGRHASALPATNPTRASRPTSLRQKSRKSHGSPTMIQRSTSAATATQTWRKTARRALPDCSILVSLPILDSAH